MTRSSVACSRSVVSRSRLVILWKGRAATPVRMLCGPFARTWSTLLVHWPNLATTSPAFPACPQLRFACKRRAAPAVRGGWMIAYSSSVRHRTRDKNKLTTVRDRANTKASKAIAMRTPSLNRSHFKRAPLRRRLHVALWVVLLVRSQISDAQATMHSTRVRYRTAWKNRNARPSKTASLAIQLLLKPRVRLRCGHHSRVNFCAFAIWAGDCFAPAQSPAAIALAVMRGAKDSRSTPFRRSNSSSG